MTLSASRRVAARRGARRDARLDAVRRAGRDRDARRAFSRSAPEAARWDHHGDRRPHTFIPRDISPVKLSALLLAASVTVGSRKARKARAPPPRTCWAEGR